MARTALVIGGTGQIGRAVALRLTDAGWDVDIAARSREHLHPEVAEVASFVQLDRTIGIDLRHDVDAVVDVIPMTANDARQLLTLAGRVESIVAISSASVYADDGGHTLDEATTEATFPSFPIPISEAQRTVAPGPHTYSSNKASMERVLLDQDALAATVVRPCAVHGPAGEFAREWHFVKRALDGRPAMILPHRGENIFHTTSVDNLAELVRLSIESPGTRVLNCGDPSPPTVLEIGRTIGTLLEADWREVLLPGNPVGTVGRNPWGRFLRPLVLDMSEAEREVGYRPVTSYPQAVAATCRFLVEERPPLGEYMETFFDYASEDRYLAGAA